MWTYFLNRMGPWSRERLGIACGRVDCDCDDEYDSDYDPYGREFSVPMMREGDWYKLGGWLGELKTEKLCGKELFDRYEKETGNKIHWDKDSQALDVEE